ncbi:MAG TPA: hypothetical protein VHT25_12515 [Solirubrobacteraceae bacterium]|jgi:hypothetical protein|nr:hypothetical protein [Solirubrobacteraceae bacterium]
MGVAGPPAAPASPRTPGASRAPAATGGSVLLAFVGATERPLSAVRGLSIGIMSATQGAYTRRQMLLDIGQGARVAASAYDPTRPPSLSLRLSGAGTLVAGWQSAQRRAEDAPQLLQPGLLASQAPGGAGYASVSGVDTLDGVAAADRRGNIGAFSPGVPATLLRRIAELQSARRLVVADLPNGAAGVADVRALVAARRPADLLIFIQRAGDGDGHELLWAAAAGLAGGGGRELSSATTNQRGLVAAVDVAPTILRRLGEHTLPAAVRGEPLVTDGRLDSAALRAFQARLHVVGGRRLKALGCLLSAWALLLLGVTLGGAGRTRARRRLAMRVGALAVLWTPIATLVAAALEPSAAVEYATIVFCSFGLAALTDRFVRWPRAPLLTALVVVLALVVDALAGTQLLVRSLLGPNPILGARFYGFGNELKSGLAVLVLAAVAAALYPSLRSRRAVLAMAAAGAALAAIEGAAKIGAGVGGVILVSAGFAVAAVMLAPGGFSQRHMLLVLASPLVALVALAALDLATAHGSGHYTGSILHASSAGELRDVIVRRYGAAWRELKNHAMPFATAIALVCTVAAVRLRRRLLAPVGEDAAWLAVLAGGLTAGVVGALSEDSGPVLFVVAVFVGGCVAVYLWGQPVEQDATRSRAGTALGHPQQPAQASAREA